MAKHRMAAWQIRNSTSNKPYTFVIFQGSSDQRPTPTPLHPRMLKLVNMQIYTANYAVLFLLYIKIYLSYKRSTFLQTPCTSTLIQEYLLKKKQLNYVMNKKLEKNYKRPFIHNCSNRRRSIILINQQRTFKFLG